MYAFATLEEPDNMRNSCSQNSTLLAYTQEREAFAPASSVIRRDSGYSYPLTETLPCFRYSRHQAQHHRRSRDHRGTAIVSDTVDFDDLLNQRDSCQTERQDFYPSTGTQTMYKCKFHTSHLRLPRFLVAQMTITERTAVSVLLGISVAAWGIHTFCSTRPNS